MLRRLWVQAVRWFLLPPLGLKEIHSRLEQIENRMTCLEEFVLPEEVKHGRS